MALEHASPQATVISVATGSSHPGVGQPGEQGVTERADLRALGRHRCPEVRRARRPAGGRPPGPRRRAGPPAAASRPSGRRPARRRRPGCRPPRRPADGGSPSRGSRHAARPARRCRAAGRRPGPPSPPPPAGRPPGATPRGSDLAPPARSRCRRPTPPRPAGGRHCCSGARRWPGRAPRSTRWCRRRPGCGRRTRRGRSGWPPGRRSGAAAPGRRSAAGPSPSPPRAPGRRSRPPPGPDGRRGAPPRRTSRPPPPGAGRPGRSGPPPPVAPRLGPRMARCMAVATVWLSSSSCARRSAWPTYPHSTPKRAAVVGGDPAGTPEVEPDRSEVPARRQRRGHPRHRFALGGGGGPGGPHHLHPAVTGRLPERRPGPVGERLGPGTVGRGGMVRAVRPPLQHHPGGAEHPVELGQADLPDLRGVPGLGQADPQLGEGRLALGGHQLGGDVPEGDHRPALARRRSPSPPPPRPPGGARPGGGPAPPPGRCPVRSTSASASSASARSSGWRRASGSQGNGGR